MAMPFQASGRQPTLAQRFMIASLIILIAGMAGIGLWVGNQIKNGVIHRTGATTALYVDSFVTPLLQEFGNTGALPSDRHEQLSKLLQDTPMGQQIVTFRVWDTTGKVIFSTDETTIGKSFPISEGLASAILGQVSSEIGQLEAVGNAPWPAIRSALLETYSPVRLSGTNEVIAVAEFYQTVDALNQEIGAAQRRSGLRAEQPDLALGGHPDELRHHQAVAPLAGRPQRHERLRHAVGDHRREVGRERREPVVGERQEAAHGHARLVVVGREALAAAGAELDGLAEVGRAHAPRQRLAPGVPSVPPITSRPRKIVG